MDGRRNRCLTTPCGVEPLATVGRVKVSRRVSITSAFGQGTAGKVSRAELAAPLTPAYGHCAVARLDSDRWPRQLCRPDPQTTTFSIASVEMTHTTLINGQIMTISTLVWSRSLESLTYWSQHMLTAQLDIISTPDRSLEVKLSLISVRNFVIMSSEAVITDFSLNILHVRLIDIETDRAPVGRQWAIKRAKKMSPGN
ncbi:hypothetical protein T4E_3710 [Trichinella pseudospiralis]|uniref:Uncharacterized protein n=1 Tax=Trichinella pseudospiralis TaxID=6337 RepID=A0A0V0YHY3_TRIPS|nr:hypothetical protein T4E_3710 [Trichinella pseudospiralis]